MSDVQTAANILVAVRREATHGVQATATGAVQMRIIDSPGLSLARGQIISREKRADALQQMGRLGNKSVAGSYASELSVGGSHSLLLEAVMRSTWVTSTAIGFVTMTAVAIGSNEITSSGGDWVSEGVRVGDIFRLTGTSEAANNDKNLRVTAITSGTLSVPAGALVTIASAATGTLTVQPKLINGSTPTRYSHTVEQYDRDIDLSQLFLGCRVVGARLRFPPNGMAEITYTMMGTDHTVLATGTSPYFDSPTVTTGLTMVADDSTILKDGVAVTKFTGLELNFGITASTVPVVGTDVSPDVFDNDLAVSGNLTAIRESFDRLDEFDAETEFALSILLEEPAASGAKPFTSFYIPRVKFGSLSAPVGGGDGAKIETADLMVGPKVAATGHDGTAVAIHSSSST